MPAKQKAMRQSWVVGTPRRGVRSAQRADPANPFAPITDASQLKPPTDPELKAALGSAGDLWHGIIHALEKTFVPLDQQWKPSKAGFGRLCLLQHKKRTLLYITPDKEKVWIAIVLGERAFRLALAGSLPAAIKKMLSDAKPYAEGRGIRFPATSLSDIPMIAKLVEIKTTPK